MRVPAQLDTGVDTGQVHQGADSALHRTVPDAEPRRDGLVGEPGEEQSEQCLVLNGQWRGASSRVLRCTNIVPGGPASA